MIVLQFNAKTSLVDIFIPKLWSTALSFYKMNLYGMKCFFNAATTHSLVCDVIFNKFTNTRTVHILYYHTFTSIKYLPDILVTLG